MSNCPLTTAAREQLTEELVSIVGPEWVITDEQTIAKRSAATVPLHRNIPLIVEPKDTGQIQAIVRAAARWKIGVYPSSTGKNWGYGEANPVCDDNVVIALHRMNRIHEVNPELAYAVVEPGVTQRQLSNHLRDGDIPLWIDAWGSSPDCSLVGNALERGFGVGPLGDHFESTCGLEVVLANGEILRTGFGHFPTSATTHVFKGGVGPDLRPLFCQSNFGIVTRMGLWLLPRPEHFEACYFTCADERKLNTFFDRLRALKLNNIIGGALQISHKNRIMSMMMRYPWDEFHGKAVSASFVEEFLARKKLGIWNGSAGLYGTKRQVAAARKVIKASLRDCTDKLLFVSSRKLRWLQRGGLLVQRLFPLPVEEILGALEASFDLMTGVPNEYGLPSVYWRNRQVACPDVNRDPARDGCGLIFHSAVVPFLATSIAETVACSERIMTRHDLEMFPTITTIGARSAVVMLPIVFDKQDSDECQRAFACHEELATELAALGYHSYRYGVQVMRQKTASGGTFWDAVAQIKQALDPHHIIAPGRYCPDGTEPTNP